MRPILASAAVLLAWAVPVWTASVWTAQAWADTSGGALSEPFAPAPTPGLAVRLDPLVVLPRESNGTAAPSGATFVVPVQGTGSLFVSSTTGKVFRTDTAGSAASVFLDLQNPPAGQGAGFTYLYGYPTYNGLSGIAFHPNFDGNPALPGYGVFYTANTVEGTPYPVQGGGDHVGETVIQEWTTPLPGSGTFTGTSRVVMALPADEASHNVGTIAFNPTAAPGSADYGMLYIASGDGERADAGGPYDPQSLGNTGGKILRIDPAASGGAPYTVPADNPFVGVAGANPAVWAYGLRNPQSFGWDRKTGTMYIDDIGESSLEEVNVGMAGANYGWPLREGTLASDGENVFPLPANDTAGFTYPIAEYDHTQGNAIGPGFVYRGSAIPALDGKYVFSDFPNGLLFYVDPAEAVGGKLATLYSMPILDASGSPECFVCVNDPGNGRADLRLGQTDDGELVAVAKATGTAYSLDAVPVPEPGTLTLFAVAGLAAVAAARRRWRS